MPISARMHAMKRRRNLTKRAANATHFPAGLLYIGSCFPYGLRTMTVLACQSQNAKVRTVMKSWLALDDERRVETEIENVCWATGISAGEFLADVMGTAFELGMDVSGVFKGMVAMPTLMIGCLAHASQSDEGVDQACRAIKFIGRMVQHSGRR